MRKHLRVRPRVRLRILEKRPVKIMREKRARASACESVLKTASESARQSASESDWEGVWESASESGRENV